MLFLTHVAVGLLIAALAMGALFFAAIGIQQIRILLAARRGDRQKIREILAKSGIYSVAGLDD